MHENIARFVHPVFLGGLDLRRRLEAGESPSIVAEQATLEDLILREPEGRSPITQDRDGVESGWAATAPGSPRWVEDIRYALTCWLDEMFILSSPWDQEWTEAKLEARLFGSNDRAWRFWERTLAVEQLPRPDALEVYYLCVSLGFRGELSESPDRLRSAIDRTRRRLAEPGSRPEIVALEPPCEVPPLHGQGRFRAMTYLAGAVAILSIPALALILVSW